jgi:hypothetical protein
VTKSAGSTGKKVKITCAAAAVAGDVDHMKIALLNHDNNSRPSSDTGGYSRPLITKAGFKQCRFMWDLC